MRANFPQGELRCSESPETGAILVLNVVQHALHLLLIRQFGPCRVWAEGCNDGSAAGLDGLRVVDSSIKPTLTSGNTNASTTFGEKASAVILQFAARIASALIPAISGTAEQYDR